MPNFLVRVELHEAKYGDGTYDILHTTMESMKFRRTIAVGGVEKKLPPAEYIFYGRPEATKKTIHHAAFVAATNALKQANVKTIPSIVVAELAGDLETSGLDEVE